MLDTSGEGLPAGNRKTTQEIRLKNCNNLKFSTVVSYKIQQLLTSLAFLQLLPVRKYNGQKIQFSMAKTKQKYLAVNFENVW